MKLSLDSIRSLQSQGTNALGRLRNGIDELRNGNFPSFGGADFAATDKDKAKFSINAFMGNLISKDLALTTHFFVTIQVSDAPTLLSFAACATSLPGYTVNTMEVRRYGVGPTYSYPVSNSLPELPITFYVDARGEVLSFFQAWANRVFNMQVSDAPDVPAHYVASYKSEYTADINIVLVDRTKEVYSQDTLRKCYPVQIGQAELAWGDSSIMRLPVTFRFDSYDYVALTAPPTTRPEASGGFLNDVRQAFNEAGNMYDFVQGVRGEIDNTVNQVRNINISNIFPRG
jgi:hypothetical protein